MHLYYSVRNIPFGTLSKDIIKDDRYRKNIVADFGFGEM